MMALDTEKLYDGYTDNVWPFAKSLAGVALLGFIMGWITDLDDTAFKGASMIFAMVAYIPYVLFRLAKDDAEAKRLDVEEAKEIAQQANSERSKALEQRNKLGEIAKAWKFKADAVKESTDALGKECERLRAMERTLLTKVQTHEKAMANAQALLAEADEQIAKAKADAQRAIANAKAEAQKPLLPYADAGRIYLKYATAKSIANPNSTATDEERAEGKRLMSDAKALLDSFVVKYRGGGNE